MTAIIEKLTWNSTWDLDIEPLDSEHREIVRLLNRVNDPNDEAPLAERLSALIDHLRRHFETEETFMRSIGYPDRDEHCREHRIQMAEFVDLHRSLSDSGSDPRVLEAGDRESVKTWFFNHVVAEDKRFAAFYHQRDAS